MRVKEGRGEEGETHLATGDAPRVRHRERHLERGAVQPDRGRAALARGAGLAGCPCGLEGRERLVRLVQRADLEVRVGEVGVREAETELEAGFDSSSIEVAVVNVKSFGVWNAENVIGTSAGG